MRRFIPLCITVLLLSGCKMSQAYRPYTPPADVDCRLIAPAGFDEISDKSNLSEDAIREWIQNHFAVSSASIQRKALFDEPKPNEDASYVWEEDNSAGSAQIVDGVPQMVTQHWLEQAPSLQQIIDCLGKPLAVGLKYSPAFEWLDAQFGLTLYFPEIGAVVSAVTRAPHVLNDVSGTTVFVDGATPANTPVMRIEIFPSSESLEKLVGEEIDRRNLYEDSNEYDRDVEIAQELSMIQPIEGGPVYLTYSTTEDGE